VIEKLQGKREDALVLEQRIPPTHSARREEHQWHLPTPQIREDVTGKDGPEVMRLAEHVHRVPRGAADHRDDGMGAAVSSRARVSEDGPSMFERNAVGIVLIRHDGTPGEAIVQWTGPVPGERMIQREFGERPPEQEYPDPNVLILRRDDALALYHALADHFGHTGNDARALRRDYDAERARVDRLIAVVTDERRPRVIVAERVQDDGTGGGL
jgi:hypothetical protein